MDRVENKEIDVENLPLRGVYTGEDPLFLPKVEEYQSHMAQIISWIDDPESTDLEQINKVIAREIAVAISSATSWNTKLLSDKVKALRELTKTLQEGEDLAKKDFLNFDGPKFKYVLQELVVLFKSSLKLSGLSEDVINHVLRVFRDNLELREVDLRRETKCVTNESLFVNFDTPEPPKLLEPPIS